jgi:urea transport system substrate-binding protein
MSGSEPDDQTRSHNPPSEPTHEWGRDLPGAGRVGEYRLIRVLGSGGMGVVWEAEDAILRRPVAVKVIKPEFATDPIYRKRFLREARAVAAIEHANVVPVYAVGADGATPFLVMPLLTGETLERRLARQPNPSPVEAVGIARDMAAGLAAAHSRGIVHRDIKPSNIWLDADTGGVRIFDFGLARSAGGAAELISHPGGVLGTPAYMAPEQAAGRPVDHRADLFSLGCVLYELLAGRRPFSGPDVMAILTALATHYPPAPCVVNPRIPQKLSQLVEQLLNKVPDNRPSSAREVLDRLAAIEFGRDDQPRSPAAETTELRPTRPSRRRFLVAGTGAIVLAGGLGAWQSGLFSRNPPRDDPAAGPPPPEPIVVGVLHSQSGTMALSEKPVIDATILAIEEINATGGVLGRPVKAVIADGKSDPDEFARQARKLLEEDRVAAIFGCWTSASRKAVRSVVERGNGVLFYPVQYEGLEQSPRVVYLGPAPNQQFIPAVEFLTKTLGKKKLFVVGSDCVSSRATSEIIKDYAQKLPGVSVVGQYYIPLGSTNALDPLTALQRANPDAIINTISGRTNFHFFQLLRQKGYTPDTLPTLSVSITENEVKGLTPGAMAGNYLAASYFQTIDRPESREFIRKLKASFGRDAVATDQMAAAYCGVHLWAKAAANAGSVDPTAVLAAVRGLEFDGPRARVRIDPTNLHAWLPVHIGRIRTDGLVDLVGFYNTNLPPHLRVLKDEIEGYAREYGLDFYETIFEVVDADDLNEIAAYGGFPTRYPHWSFGMQYEELKKGYEYGLSKIYEMVINNDPCYAYLMRCNHTVDQKLVMAHVYGHCDFFKNNAYFAHTTPQDDGRDRQPRARIRRYVERFGEDEVEAFVDRCMSIDDLIDIHSVAIKRRDDHSRYDFAPQPADDDEDERPARGSRARTYMEDYINPPTP